MVKYKKILDSQKDEMRNFVLGAIEHTPNLRVVEDCSNSYLLFEKRIGNKTRLVFVLLHYGDFTVKNYEKLSKRILSNSWFELNLFYNNSSRFLRPLSDFEKERIPKSLKKYSYESYRKMVFLNKLEREIGKKLGFKFIAYFRPKQESSQFKTLESAIELYDLEDVLLDYSHIKEKGDVIKNKVSLEFKILNRVRIIYPFLDIKLSSRTNFAIFSPYRKDFSKDLN